MPPLTLLLLVGLGLLTVLALNPFGALLGLIRGISGVVFFLGVAWGFFLGWFRNSSSGWYFGMDPAYYDTQFFLQWTLIAGAVWILSFVVPVMARKFRRPVTDADH